MARLRWLTAAGLLLGSVVPASAQSGTLTVDSVLVRARRWLGPATLERVRSLRAVAEVNGPPGCLWTVIRSRIDGRVRFEQHDSSGPKFIAGIGQAGPWTWSIEDGKPVAASPATASVISGHEWHLLTAYPTSRWSAPKLIGRHVVEGDTVWRVDFKDRLGATVSIRYAGDGRPVDLLLVNHSGQGPKDVRVRLFDWPPAGDGPRLFRHAVILHGNQTWLYHYLSLESDTGADAAYEASAPIDPPAKMDSGVGCS
jgi:hypothetical protein